MIVYVCINYALIMNIVNTMCAINKLDIVTINCYVRYKIHVHYQTLFTLLDVCVSSLRRGHAILLCIAPSLMDDPPTENCA